MSDAITRTSPDILSSGLDRLRGPKAKTIEKERSRLKKATQEFESFFTYQMLKTMRKTIPESPFSKNSPMSAGAGKETFTDIFDMEIARKMNRGDSRSISELLYKSLEKLVESEYKAAEAVNVELKALRPGQRSPIKIGHEEKTIEVNNAPIKIETDNHEPFELMHQNRTGAAQNVSKKPQAP